MPPASSAGGRSGSGEVSNTVPVDHDNGKCIHPFLVSSARIPLSLSLHISSCPPSTQLPPSQITPPSSPLSVVSSSNSHLRALKTSSETPSLHPLHLSFTRLEDLLGDPFIASSPLSTRGFSESILPITQTSRFLCFAPKPTRPPLGRAAFEFMLICLPAHRIPHFLVNHAPFLVIVGLGASISLSFSLS